MSADTLIKVVVEKIVQETIDIYATTLQEAIEEAKQKKEVIRVVKAFYPDIDE